MYVCVCVCVCVCSGEDEIQRCIGALDEMLDLYDDDDDNDADLYRSGQTDSDITPEHLLPLTSCARTAVRNLEIRKSMTAGFIALSAIVAFIAFS